MIRNLAIIATALQLSAIPPTFAQQQNATSADNTKLTQQFRDGFLKGCNSGKTPSVKSQATYCNCLASAYQARYSGAALNAITQLSGASGENGARLANVMMSPEAKTCAAKSR